MFTLIFGRIDNISTELISLQFFIVLAGLISHFFLSTYFNKQGKAKIEQFLLVMIIVLILLTITIGFLFKNFHIRLIPVILVSTNLLLSIKGIIFIFSDEVYVERKRRAINKIQILITISVLWLSTTFSEDLFREQPRELLFIIFSFIYLVISIFYLFYYYRNDYYKDNICKK